MSDQAASDVRITILNNGLRILSENMPRLRSTAVGVWVEAGARYEDEATNGVAHMLEHMAFKGTKRRSAFDIAAEIEAVGGHLNAYTSREQTAYFARVLEDDLALAVDILADILQHPTFAPEELERERMVVLQEIGQTEDTPDDLVFDHLQAVAYPDQAMGRSILGTVEKVTNMSGETLSRFMAAHYSAPNMLLSAAGAVDHEALVALAREKFANLAEHREQSFAPAQFAGGERREDRALEQVHLAVALPGITYDDPDFYACQVMSTVLGGGMSSRLFQEVREKRGLCYSVFSFSSSFADGGMFGIYAATGAEEVDELAHVVASEFRRLADAVTAEEVDRARAQLKAGLMMSMEAPSARAEQLARQMMIYGRPLGADEIIAKVDAVDGGDVCAIAGRLLNAGAPALAAVGPIGGLADYPEIAAKFTMA